MKFLWSNDIFLTNIFYIMPVIFISDLELRL
jgi:hypothetical protein